MSDVTTVVGNNFPNYDITHKSKRSQSQVADEIAAQEPVVDKASVNLTAVPQSVTIESAIAYFKAHADGAYKNLYLRTALALEELLQLRQEIKKRGETQTTA